MQLRSHKRGLFIDVYKRQVVILTAYSDFDYAKKAIALGIENYLLKPVNLTELKNTLSKIKEEIFVEQRGKNSLSLETVIKDALEGEYEEDSRLEETLLEKYGFSGRKQIYCMYPVSYTHLDVYKRQLVIGYTSEKYAYIDPADGERHSATPEEMAQMVSGSGNVFFGYVK